MFGLFAGCYNSNLVALDQRWETTFLFGDLSTCCVICSLQFSQVFFSCNLASRTISLFGKLVILYD